MAWLRRRDSWHPAPCHRRRRAQAVDFRGDLHAGMRIATPGTGAPHGAHLGL